MALKKNNIRSIRFSDELLEIIEQQVGDNFTQKFERLVYNCYMLAAEKEKEIHRLDDMIRRQREQLQHYQKELRQLSPMVGSIQRQLKSVDHFLEEYINEGS